jgi:hypothetical protein
LRSLLWDRLWGPSWGWASVITAVTASYMTISVLALAAWRINGDLTWVVKFFQAPGAALLIGLAALGLWLTLSVIACFSPGDLLRPAWTLIACSAAVHLCGLVFSQIIGIKSPGNPLLVLTGLPDSSLALANHFGQTIGGTVRFGLLSAGLCFALKAYRQSGMLARLAPIDWLVLTAFAGYLARNVWDVARAFRAGIRPDIWHVLSWPVDPLLWLLLAEAVLLFRSARQMEPGRIGLCWKAMAMGVFLTALADVGMWASAYGYLPWPWDSLIWYLWIPAAAAFARAPALQLETIREAATGRPGGFA